MIIKTASGQIAIDRSPVTAKEHLEQAIVLRSMGQPDRVAFWQDEVAREQENHRP